MITGKFRNAVENIMEKKKRATSKSPSRHKSNRRSGHTRLPNRYRHMSVYAGKSSRTKEASTSAGRRGSLDSMQDLSRTQQTSAGAGTVSHLLKDTEQCTWYPDRLQCVVISHAFALEEHVKQELAGTLFEHFFHNQPDAQRMFTAFQHYKDSRLAMRSADMQRHVSAFLAVLDYVVNNLHQRTDVVCYLHQVGARHRRLRDSLRPAHWRAMTDALSTALQTAPCNTDQGHILSTQLWPKLAALITGVVREGYENTHD